MLTQRRSYLNRSMSRGLIIGMLVPFHHYHAATEFFSSLLSEHSKHHAWNQHLLGLQFFRSLSLYYSAKQNKEPFQCYTESTLGPNRPCSKNLFQPPSRPLFPSSPIRVLYSSGNVHNRSQGKNNQHTRAPTLSSSPLKDVHRLQYGDKNDSNTQSFEFNVYNFSA